MWAEIGNDILSYCLQKTGGFNELSVPLSIKRLFYAMEILKLHTYYFTMEDLCHFRAFLPIYNVKYED